MAEYAGNFSRAFYLALFILYSCSSLPFQDNAYEFETVFQDMQRLLDKTPLGVSSLELQKQLSQKPTYQDSIGYVYRNIYPGKIQCDIEFYFEKDALISVIINLSSAQETQTKLIYLRWVEYFNRKLKLPAQGSLGNYYWRIKNAKYNLRLHPSEKIITLNLSTY